ncbi:hypothetical protein GCM10010116_03770 [Microbispora rosea subsp. aerata]|nr:hypothetical protein GCM10010116_03770 [Microbispora rosea subsp. aerata]GIH54722.1 hypothetical protein Mro02_16360 [Microbispora rosea subsp. aerata]GLJ86342.1 hypothetical protein GCM10017588_50780 [Microbispora rosea subsp. aerata]
MTQIQAGQPAKELARSPVWASGYPRGQRKAVGASFAQEHAGSSPLVVLSGRSIPPDATGAYFHWK